MLLSKHLHIFLILLFSVGFSWGQNAPAADRGITHTDYAEKVDDQNDEVEQELFQKPIKEKIKSNKRFKRPGKIGKGGLYFWEEFWTIFLVVLGILIVLAGLASFFLFNLIGWWVVLTALGGVVAGCFVIYGAEMIDPHKLAGLGAIISGVFGLIGWLVGIIAVAIYNAIVN